MRSFLNSPISYEAARIIVISAGETVGIHLQPHDLRRHAAKYASRSGVPTEIVSKIILRHASLNSQFIPPDGDITALLRSSL